VGSQLIVVVMVEALDRRVLDLSYLAQDALDHTRAIGGTAFGDALAGEGFDETTRGAIGLADDGADAGPAPGIL
jgi:hypothetical protein